MEIKKDRWTEDEILALPIGESDKFDRKEGTILSDTGYEEKIAKALSALSNSGGGHLILGVKDDGFIDGVKEFHKGRTKTREWLEQKIPYLLTPILQDFRVHDVEKSNPSLIPQDKIIIVIDVGDSNFAPHQSSKDNHYYYRAGGHSKAAPHQHLEFLWKREIYPGPRIAGAWVYRVINLLLNRLTWEIKYLSEMDWNFDRHHQDSSTNLEVFQTKYQSGNYEQFYDFYDDIFQLVRRHDEEVEAFIKDLKHFFEAIKNSKAIRDKFKAMTTIEALERLKDEKYSQWNYRIMECNTHEEFFTMMFPRLDESQIYEIFAQKALNGHSLVHDADFGPFWNVYSNEFLWLREANCDENTVLLETKDKLLETLNLLYQMLRDKRNFLCTKYQIPFEEYEQIIIQNRRF